MPLYESLSYDKLREASDESMVRQLGGDNRLWAVGQIIDIDEEGTVTIEVVVRGLASCSNPCRVFRKNRDGALTRLQKREDWLK